MSDIGVETVVAPTVNGGRDGHAAEPVLTVLAKEDILSGRLQVRGNGSVLGTFSGNIDCDGELLIGQEAHVEADIRASRVTVAGFVRGNVVAVSRLKITSTGRLEGDARVGALVVQEGGVHRGVIRVHPEGIPEGQGQDGGHAISTVRTETNPALGLGSLPNPVARVRKFWGEFF